MMNRLPLLLGSLLTATGIALGAFAAHGLRTLLDANQLSWWHTAVEYQMWQGIGLIALAGNRQRQPLLPIVMLAAGTIIFSGSLYLLALTNWHWLGAITPLGGLLMIGSWLTIAWRAFRSR